MSYQLFAHQKAAVDFIMERGGSGCLYMEMGTGKTLCGIELLIRLRKIDPKTRMLVICPLTLIESAWGEDVKKFAPELKFQNLRNKREKNFYGDILALNYEMTRRDDFENAIIYLRSFGPLICFLDESSRIKGFRTQTTQRIISSRRYFQYRICASGTPAPNTELEYWPQLNFIDPDILPSNFYAFRASYFWLTRNGSGVDMPSGRALIDYLRVGYKYTARPEKKELLESKLNEAAFTCRIDSCLDLPETIEKHYNIPMHPEQKKVYTDMERHMIAEIRGRDVAVNIALTKLGKLRQIASGFIYDDEHSLDLPNPKLKELENLVEDIGDQQVIIWVNFRKERQDISTVMNGKTFGVLDGETKDKDPVIDDFKRGRTRYLIANPASAGHGLTLVGCHHQIFYSLNYSFELFAQAKARTHRAGQRHSTVYHYLLMYKSIEPIILKVLRNKGDKQDILREWLR